MSRHIILPALLLGLVSVCSTAQATILVFTDKPTWETAVQNSFTTETFNQGSNLGLGDPLPRDTNLDVGNNINLFYETADLTNNSQIRLDATGTSNNRLQLRQDTNGGSQTTTLRLFFDAPVAAFAADFLSVDDGAGLSLTINGEIVNLDSALGGNPDGFLGFITSQDFSQVDFSGGDTIFQLDNAFTSQVPEPSTLVGLMTLGVVGLCSATRRRRRR